MIDESGSNELLTMRVTSEDINKNIDRVLDRAVERMLSEITKYYISIEWIKKWCDDEPYWSNLAMHLIEDWERENG